MTKKILLFLFSAVVILCAASSVLFACSERIDSPKFLLSAPAKVNYSQPFTNDEQPQRIIDTAGQSRNFAAVFSKPDGTRILDDIKFQRTRTIIFSEKAASNHNFPLSLSKTASEENKTRSTEIHQDIQQRK